MPFEYLSRRRVISREIRFSKGEPCTKNEAGDRSHGPRVRERDGDDIVERCPNCGVTVDTRSDPLIDEKNVQK